MPHDMKRFARVIQPVQDAISNKVSPVVVDKCINVSGNAGGYICRKIRLPNPIHDPMIIFDSFRRIRRAHAYVHRPCYTKVAYKFADFPDGSPW